MIPGTLGLKYRQFQTSFSVSMTQINSVHHSVSLLRCSFKQCSDSASICRLCHPSRVHAVWTDFLTNPQSWWLPLAVDIRSLKGYQYLLVPLVHPPSWKTSQDAAGPDFLFPPFNVFLWAIFLMMFHTQLTAVLYTGAGFLVTVFVAFACFNERSSPGRLWLFTTESVTLLVDSLYAETTKSQHISVV